jgi:hydroxymethylbilane synthase
LTLINCLNHQPTATRVLAEREVNKRLQGGCQVPIASYAEFRDDDLWLRALVGTIDGSRIIRSECAENSSRAKKIGRKVAEDLLSQGAGEILEALRV